MQTSIVENQIHAIIIEDNKIFRFVFSNMLKQYPNHDIIIKEYENGTEVLNDLQNNNNFGADLIFIDLNMPTLTGWELLDKLHPHLLNKLGYPKIFIISSSISRLDRENLKNYPFVSSYITKPFTKEQLFNILDEVLSDLD